MVDTKDSKSFVSDGVRVQVSSPVGGLPILGSPFFFNDRYSSGTNDAHNLCKSMASCIWVASIWGDWSRSAMVRAVLMQLEMARGEKL